MKKSLFAVAALSAIAGAAQAQSSVTVYGILDVGYVGSNQTAVAAQVAGVNNSTQNAVKKTTISQFGQNAEQTSRLGFKGNEDLGGGTSAFFTVELGLTPQNPSLSGGTASTATSASIATNTTGINADASGTAIDNRQSFVGLKKNGIGQAAFGRQYTPVFMLGAVTDPGANNNMAGNLTYVNAGGDANAGFGNTVAYTNRASNAMTIASDKFAGFGVNGMYAMNNQNVTSQGTATGGVTGGNTNWGGWGIGGDFTWQKLYIGAAYQSFKYVLSNPNALTAVDVNFGAVTSTYSVNPTANSATNLSDKQTLVGATYDFGILKAYAQWVGRKVNQGNTISTTLPAGVQFNRNAQQIGVRSYITPAIEGWASVGNGKYRGADTATGAATTVNMTGYQLGANYYLSKRTNLYAIYGSNQSSGASAGVAGSGSSLNSYALGMRHTF